MTRYDVFDKIEKLCELQKTGEHMYNKMIQSGQLAETHCDYNRGYYDVCIFYLFMNKKHYCRIWFGTIDDGDFGSWNELTTKEKAIEMVEKAKNLFKEMTVCPSYIELNKLFQNIGIYFCHE